MTPIKIIADYRCRINNYDTLLHIETSLLKVARQAQDPAPELAVRRAEIRRLNDLRQLCLQVTKDLEDLL
jgi:hypothetical protein